MINGTDLTGQVLNNRRVLYRDTSMDRVVWVVECLSCGKRARKRTTEVKQTSCQHCKMTTHGMSNTPTYNSWRSMRKRCDDKNNKCYKWYGGAGVTYDPRWSSFEVFFEEMGERPEGMTLDKDSIKPGNKVYCKEYCCWSTPKTQQRNKRNTIFTKEIADEIRVLYAAGGITQKELAEMFNTIQQNISFIIAGKTWN